MRTGTNLALWWSHMSVQVVLLTGNGQPKIKLLKAFYTETRNFIIMIMSYSYSTYSPYSKYISVVCVVMVTLI